MLQKNIKIQLIAILLLPLCFIVNAQPSERKSKIAVLSIDSKGFNIDATQMGNLVRTELDKIATLDVLDKYDVEYILEKEKINAVDCFGKICLIDVGKKLKAEKMLTGSVELYEEAITINLRIIDVGTGETDKTQVMTFLNIRNQIQSMLAISVSKMFEQPVDEELLKKLTKKDDYVSAINEPEEERLNLNGPRMGIVVFTGEVAKIYRAPSKDGGFNAYPVMVQFGYQFEAQYVNQGSLQALVEFVPTITGLDQGKFIPSVALLNGLRSSRNGWEVAFGPTFVLTKKAKGYYDPDKGGAWFLEQEWTGTNPNSIETRLDSRGDYTVAANFIFAVGKTFKSGKLNIPVNAFFIPDYKNGSRFGVSVGFNAKGKKK